ncbi:hypothetical protein [Simkania sp.]|uniref:hypothetical protein n=1 Tax=Simkania sp. TaxID=34094 RepID=UPI003B52B625
MSNVNQTTNVANSEPYIPPATTDLTQAEKDILSELQLLSQTLEQLDPKQIAAELEKKGVPKNQAEEEALEEAKQRSSSSYYISRLTNELQSLKGTFVEDLSPQNTMSPKDKETLKGFETQIDSVLNNFVDPVNTDKSILDCAGDPDQMKYFFQDVLYKEPRDIDYVVDDLDPVEKQLHQAIDKS